MITRQIKLGIKIIKLQEELKKEIATLCRDIENNIIDFTNKNSVFIEKISILYDGDDSIDFGNFGELTKPIASGDLKIEVITDPTISPAIKLIPTKSQSNPL